MQTLSNNFFLNTKLRRPDFRGFPSDYDTLMKTADDSYLFLPLWNGHVLIENCRVVFWTAPELQYFLSEKSPSDEAHPLIARLCVANNPPTNYVAVDLSPREFPSSPETQHALPMRQAFSFLSETDATMVAHAKTLMDWHASAIFCSQCGAMTSVKHGGNARVCYNAECSTLNIYPRVMPSVIILVIRLDTNEVLLGRKASWPKNRYSVIAGYVEIFESLEQAVAREVHEETGVIVDEKSIMYHSSQPWPSLPHASLMSAFRAYVQNEQHACINVDKNELEDAKWFDRYTLRKLLDKEGGITIPGRTSVARRLISDWLRESDDSR
ncbi:unnamed protein product [Agarophyton chilense]